MYPQPGMIVSGAMVIGGGQSPSASGWSPPVVSSGAIGSGQITEYYLASGAVQSGSLGTYPPPCCDGCKQPLGRPEVMVYGNTISGGRSPVRYCPSCAGFAGFGEGEGFNGVGFIEKHIRASAPYGSEAPAGELADMLRDQGRTYDADFMLKLHQRGK